MKRLTVLAVAVAMLFAGCSSSEPAAPTATPTATPTVAPSAAPSETAEFTVADKYTTHDANTGASSANATNYLVEILIGESRVMVQVTPECYEGAQVGEILVSECRPGR